MHENPSGGVSLFFLDLLLLFLKAVVFPGTLNSFRFLAQGETCQLGQEPRLGTKRAIGAKWPVTRVQEAENRKLPSLIGSSCWPKGRNSKRKESELHPRDDQKATTSNPKASCRPRACQHPNVVKILDFIALPDSVPR